VFVGTIVGGGGTNTLELAKGATTGTLSGFATQFTGFGAITIGAGAYWAFDASDTLAVGTTVGDSGTATFSEAAGVDLTLASAISGSGDVVQNGSGTLFLDGNNNGFTGGITLGGGTLELSSGNAAGARPILFDADTTLRVDGEVMPTGTLHGLAAGDEMDFVGVTFTNAGTAPVINGDTLQVVENSTIYDLALDPGQDYSGLVFQRAQDSGTGTIITVDPACYVGGTRILTTRGEVAVERLRIGDQVVTASGVSRPIRWIGRRRINLSRHSAPERVAPIRIRAGAFADNVPRRDLLLSPDHAVLRDGLLIPARLLVNGASIARATWHRNITYFHVELDVHDILLAENLPAESYLDTGNRRAFENAGGLVVLHPDFTNDQKRREVESCAPLATDAARLEPIWRALAARALQLGMRLPATPMTTNDPLMRVEADGCRLAPVSVGMGGAGGLYAFVLPHSAATFRLVSRSVVSSEMAPWIADDRRLGVMVSALTARSGERRLPIPLDHPAFRDGWWHAEWHTPTTLRRWTNGDADVRVGPPARGVETVSV
jgi:autotransporter-associated beta strand protein